MNTDTEPSGIDLEPRRLLGAGRAAFDEAADGEAVMAPVDEPALELRFLRPAEFCEAAVERDPVVAAVDLVLGLERRDGRERIGHGRRRNEVAAPELDAIDAEIGGDHVQQTLAEEIGLEAAGTAIGADRRLVGHPQRGADLDVGDRVGPRHELGDVARAHRAVGAHIGAHVDVGVAAQAEDDAVAAAGDLDARPRLRGRGSWPSDSRGGPRSTSRGARHGARRTE